MTTKGQNKPSTQVEKAINTQKTFCIFTALYLPTTGGVQRYIYNLGLELKKEGFKVIIVTSNSSDLPSEQIEDGMTIYRMPVYKLLNGRFPMPKKNREWENLNKLLSSLDIDFVISATRIYLHNLFAANFAHKHKLPIIMLEHGTNHFTVNNVFADMLGSWYEHFITFLIKKKCKDFYGVSESCNDWLKHFGINAKGTLYNAVDVDAIQRVVLNVTKDIRIKNDIKPNKTIVSYIGRLVKDKGILKLIDAIEVLNKNSPDNQFSLLVAGDGPLQEEIDKKAEADPSIITFGKIDFDHVVSLLSQSDIFCLPTDYPEGFPTSVLEAVATKCFCITTTAGGSKELIVNRDFGIILKENTVEELAFELQNAAENSEFRQSAAENAYKKLLSDFTWNKTENKVINAFAQTS